MDHECFKAELGATLKDRQLKILGVAQELGNLKKLDHVTWRRQLAQAIAKKLEAPDTFARYVYQLMNNMKPSELAKIRVACIGDEAEASFYGNRFYGNRARNAEGFFVPVEKIRRIRKGAEEKRETDEERAERIRKSVENAIDTLPSDSRTPEALAKALDWKADVVKSYLFQNPETAQKLSPG
jgi:lactam utilization protein B